MASSRGSGLAFNIRRKLFHVLLGIFIVYLINSEASLIRGYLVYALFWTLIVGLGLSVLSRYYRIPGIFHLLEAFDKREDLVSFPGKGAFFFMTGCLISIILFDRQVASAAILVLTFGDPVASFVGRYYGRTRSPISSKKLLEGTLAGIAAGAFAASFFVPVWQAILCSSAGMIVEAAELEYIRVDDNLLIPVAAGIALRVARMLV
jgi:dolichol kinase